MAPPQRRSLDSEPLPSFSFSWHRRTLTILLASTMLDRVIAQLLGRARRGRGPIEQGGPRFPGPRYGKRARRPTSWQGQVRARKPDARGSGQPGPGGGARAIAHRLGLLTA